MRVIYVAGPYRGDTVNEIHHNIQAARLAAEAVWNLGLVALCPHTNTAYMDGLADDEIFLAGGLELMRRCDAVYVFRLRKGSRGTQAEIDEANRIGIPVLYNIGQIIDWASDKEPEDERGA